MIRPNKNVFKMQRNDVHELFTPHDSRYVHNEVFFTFVSLEVSNCSSRYTASLCVIRFFACG